MKKHHFLSLLASAALIAPVAAYADSTTATSVAIAGKPVPGKQVTATVVVTGKHLVDGPPHTVNGGDVQLMLNGKLVAQVRASFANSDVYDSGCVDLACGLYIYRSRNTTVTFRVTLPKDTASYQFSGAYTGDTDSHASTSSVVSVKPVFEGVSAAIDLLLD